MGFPKSNPADNGEGKEMSCFISDRMCLTLCVLLCVEMYVSVYACVYLYVHICGGERVRVILVFTL